MIDSIVKFLQKLRILRIISRSFINIKTYSKEECHHIKMYNLSIYVRNTCMRKVNIFIWRYFLSVVMSEDNFRKLQRKIKFRNHGEGGNSCCYVSANIKKIQIVSHYSRSPEILTSGNLKIPKILSFDFLPLAVQKS